MTIISKLRIGLARTTGFFTIPVTVLLVLIYLAVLISTLVTDQLEAVPSSSTLQSRYGGLNVTEAYEDLHVIAALPHPYHSHANDLVREYLLERVKSIRDLVRSSRGQNASNTAFKAKSNSRAGQVLIDDDLISNGTWTSGAGFDGNYFEGSNILVKICGASNSSPPLPAVLLSAHFDSVSTSFGATDDGMGIVVLLQLIKYFSIHTPRRTVLVNINNGEEDGLQGAHALLEHPWIKDPTNAEFVNMVGATFINLEGAASGGRPLMFRATDIDALRSWKGVSKPHANVLSAKAFDLGVIRSSTDYSVYTNPFAVPNTISAQAEDQAEYLPMRGLDFSFYRGRSKYHTKYDAISYTEGGDRALWAMMEPAWAAGVALANDEGSTKDVNTESAVYFELFGVALIVFPLTYLLTFNITALVAGPIALILLAVCESALARSRAAKRVQPTFSPSVAGSEDEAVSAEQLISSRTVASSTAVDESESVNVEVERTDTPKRSRFMQKLRVSWAVLWNHAQFWVALVVAIAAHVGLVAGFVNLNAFVVYGHPALPILSSFTLSIVVLAFVLAPPLPRSTITAMQIKSRASVPAWHSFRTLLTHSYIFTWVLLLLSTLGITQFNLGGVTYLVSAWNALIWLGSVLCIAAGCFGVAELSTEEIIQPIREPGTTDHPAEEDEQANERTPLVRKRLRLIKNSNLGVAEDPQPYLLWILLMIILVPFPLIFMSHIAVILVPSINQTLSDGSSAVVVYGAISLLALASALPTIPFLGARKVHRYVLWLLGAIFVVSIALAWIPWSGAWTGSFEAFRGGLFPFSDDAPLKIFFQQQVEVSSAANLSLETNAKIVTTLTGASPFLEEMILPLLPSYLNAVANGREASCSSVGVDARKVGLKRCKWETEAVGVSGMSMMPLAGDLAVGPETLTKPNSHWNWTSTNNPWFESHVKAVSFNTSSSSAPIPGARIFVTGNNSRACRIYFDSPIAKFRVRTVDATSAVDDDQEASSADNDTTWEMQRGYDAQSFNLVKLWSRSWEKTFVVDVQWPSDNSSSDFLQSDAQSVLLSGAKANAEYGTITERHTHSGRVACEWAEYESGMVGLGLSTSPLPSPSGRRVSGGKIPAYEEVLSYLPKWATVSKLTDGLVEVEQKFVF